MTRAWIASACKGRTRTTALFDNLSEKLGGILDRLTGRGALSEKPTSTPRCAKCAARCSRPTSRSRWCAPSSSSVREQAVGATVVKSVTPGQMVVKIVHDELVATLGADGQTIDLNARAAGRHHDGRPAGLRQNHHHREARAPSDPARQAQGADGLARHPPPGGDGAAGRARPRSRHRRRCRSSPARSRRRSPSARSKPAKLGGYDVVLLDTAGRTTLDEEMMAEAAEIKAAANPHEVLLVADSLTGQDAVNLARAFDERVGLTGIVLTRVDGDGRGGAALSMRAVTGKPIKLIGTGEKTDALEDFHPEPHRRPHPRHGRRRVAGREGRREHRRREGRAHRRADAQGPVRPRPTCASSCCRWRTWAASAA